MLRMKIWLHFREIIQKGKPKEEDCQDHSEKSKNSPADDLMGEYIPTHFDHKPKTEATADGVF